MRLAQTQIMEWQGRFLHAVGNPALRETRQLGLFCSVKCPGSLILRTYDLAVALREAGVMVISGFHSPMEKECLELLLRGTQPVVVCMARGIEGMRIPVTWSKPLDQGRLLIVSPFEHSQRRVTSATSEARNRIVADLADKVFVAYAAPGGRTERFCRDLLASGKPVLTFDSSQNADLMSLGAMGVSVDDTVDHIIP